MFNRKLISSLISLNRVLSVISPSRLTSIRHLSEVTSNGDPEGKKLIAVVQLNCKADKDENYRISEKLIREASSFGCSMAFLPEEFIDMCFTKEDVAASAEPIDGPTITKYRKLAKSANIWLSLGGFIERQKDNDDIRGYNTHLVVNNFGEIVSVYRKIHLYNVDVPGPQRVIESNIAVAGNEIVPPVQTPIGKVGLGICYDMSFPEFGIALSKAGANILTYPSCHSLETGAALWEPFLRSRALENQCYVVAAAQTGIHNSKRTSYGHSMVVDPRGCIIAQVGEDAGLAIAVIDPVLQRKAKVLLPVVNDRRPELYGQIIAPRVK